MLAYLRLCDFYAFCAFHTFCAFYAPKKKYKKKKVACMRFVLFMLFVCVKFSRKKKTKRFKITLIPSFTILLTQISKQSSFQQELMIEEFPQFLSFSIWTSLHVFLTVKQ